MSNPAVTKLTRASIGPSKFWMDDNIGESVHIHLDDLRLDLTCDELNALAKDLNETINHLVDVDGFDCNHIDPVFLQLYLAKLLPYLDSVKMDEVSVGDLIVSHGIGFGCCKYQKIADSRAVKALNGDSKENDDHRKSHHIGQSSQDRLDAMNQSISDNGYGYNGNLIILYNDQMLVRDGQHRAACIYNSLGNVKIPVLRLYFKGLPINIDTVGKSYFSQFFISLKNRKFNDGKRSSKKSLRNAYRSYKSIKDSFYLKMHKKELERLNQSYYCRKL